MFTLQQWNQHFSGPKTDPARQQCCIKRRIFPIGSELKVDWTRCLAQTVLFALGPLGGEDDSAQQSGTA